MELIPCMIILTVGSDVTNTRLQWITAGVLGLLAVGIGWRLYTYLLALRHKTDASPESSIDTTRSSKNRSRAENQARLCILLLNNGGRMRQKQIIDATGWSKTKVSTLLTDMEANNQLSKIRLGKENVVVLAGYESNIMSSSTKDEQHEPRE